MQLADASVTELLRAWRQWIEEHLDRLLTAVPGCPDRLLAAMRYSVLAGGKRLRPILVLLAADACQGTVPLCVPAACAVELIHTYSLIHDDLPAMDDDDLRRGVPTCHKQFDEATAILAGDALLTMAFEVLATLEPAARAAQAVALVAQAAGRAGMVGGQMDDLLAQQVAHDLDWLTSMQQRKTGALLSAALQLGAVLAEADGEKQEALRRYGQAIGLAFQITDDLLDLESDSATLGKEAQKDAAAGKLTYPHLLGVAESRRRARMLVVEACECLRPFGPHGHRLALLADYIVKRDR